MVSLSHALLLQLLPIVKRLTILLMTFSCTTGGAAPPALYGCSDRCGNLTIPYPFGIGDSCYREDRFKVTCDDSTTPPKAYLGTGTLNLTEISLFDGELQVLQYVAKDCYDQHGSQRFDDSIIASLEVSGFTISDTKNKFTAIGCDTYAIVRGNYYNQTDEMYTTGCMSLCNRFEDIDFDSCSGIGCCQISSLPSGLQNISVSLDSYSNHSKVWSFNPCSYAILAEESQFKFSTASFKEFQRRTEFPLVLDWTMGNFSCDEARKLKDYACTGNSTCTYKNTSFGYLCQCLDGFEGNPYHPQGCRDIDECKYSNPCINGICNNIAGAFNCSCQKGYVLTNKTICEKASSGDGTRRALFLYIPLGVSTVLVVLLAMSLMLCWGIRKRKLIKLKEKFFEQNGGLMLQQRLSSEKGPFETTKIFTAEELEKATNNYHESRIIGEGGYGTVYKGILPNNKVVAIKKSKFGAQIVQTEQTEQFINEVIVLMQINHRNVVRLLGCCLETEVPLLVYEFITNGTLFQHLHNKGTEAPSLSWELRLKIAAETAGALSYLHYETNTPIVHRDVKTMNILLDENYTTKVSDFGTSRLIPQDQDQLSTLVQGTVGYLDPEYLQSSQLTEKSDVYSFGVVLGELLTGKKAFIFDKSKGVSHVLSMFLLSLKEDDQLHKFIDDEILNDGNMEVIKEVANLTKRCLRIKGEERPTMKEVAMELEGLRAMSKHPWRNVDHLHTEETEYLLGARRPVSTFNNSFDLEYGSSSTTTAVYDSMQNQLILMPNGNGR
ncbi:Wall-associated receptor kinase [Parasponia andersonii]|uniref:Wall-associated receptor kinase n=1 Tax=Parasponia andersonii TaxID=3476 RepID=A0A2P5BNA6_PARAD|nr:Wall-associated receptor kinase [Parasponia andersonii]